MNRALVLALLLGTALACSESTGIQEEALHFCREEGGVVEYREREGAKPLIVCVFRSTIVLDGGAALEDAWECEVVAFFEGRCEEESDSFVPPLQGGPARSMGDSVIAMVDSLMGRLAETRYTNTGYIVEVEAGRLHLDCSYWAKQVLTRVSERHYDRLPKSGTSGTTALAADYFDFFTSLEAGDTLWQRVSSISQARPGDIIAYSYGGTGGATTGHVVILYTTPQWSTCSDGLQHWAYITDAARSGHGADTRNGEGAFAATYSYTALPGSSGKPSGVGIGKMWFNTGSDPYYRWSSCAGTRHHIPIAIGRLVGP